MIAWTICRQHCLKVNILLIYLSGQHTFASRMNWTGLDWIGVWRLVVESHQADTSDYRRPFLQLFQCDCSAVLSVINPTSPIHSMPQRFKKIIRNSRRRTKALRHIQEITNQEILWYQNSTELPVIVVGGFRFRVLQLEISYLPRKNNRIGKNV